MTCVMSFEIKEKTNVCLYLYIYVWYAYRDILYITSICIAIYMIYSPTDMWFPSETALISDSSEYTANDRAVACVCPSILIESDILTETLWVRVCMLPENSIL